MPNREQRRQPKTSALRPETVTRLESIRDVAFRLSLTEKEIRRMVADGRLFSVKLGRRRLIPAEETDRYIAALVEAAAS
jgi:excisionase family DNA binding protein